MRGSVHLLAIALALLVSSAAGTAGAQAPGAATSGSSATTTRPVATGGPASYQPAKSALKGAEAAKTAKAVTFDSGAAETHRVGIDAASRKARLSADYDSYLKARNPSYQGFDPKSQLKATGGHGSGGAKPGNLTRAQIDLRNLDVFNRHNPQLKNGAKNADQARKMAAEKARLEAERLHKEVAETGKSRAKAVKKAKSARKAKSAKSSSKVAKKAKTATSGSKVAKKAKAAKSGTKAATTAKLPAKPGHRVFDLGDKHAKAVDAAKKKLAADRAKGIKKTQSPAQVKKVLAEKAGGKKIKTSSELIAEQKAKTAKAAKTTKSAKKVSAAKHAKKVTKKAKAAKKVVKSHKAAKKAKTAASTAKSAKKVKAGAKTAKKVKTVAKAAKTAKTATKAAKVAKTAKKAKTAATAVKGAQAAKTAATAGKAAKAAMVAKGAASVAKASVASAVVSDITGADQLLVDAITDPKQSFKNATDPKKVDAYVEDRIDYFEEKYAKGGHLKSAAGALDRATGGELSRTANALDRATGGALGAGTRAVGTVVERQASASVGLLRDQYNDTVGTVLNAPDAGTGARNLANNALKLKPVGNTLTAIDRATGGHLSQGLNTIDRATGGRLGAATRDVSRTWNRAADQVTNSALARGAGQVVNNQVGAATGLLRDQYNDTIGSVVNAPNLGIGVRNLANNGLKLKPVGNALTALNRASGGHLGRGLNNVDRATGGRLGTAARNVGRTWNAGADYVTNGGLGRDLGRGAQAIGRGAAAWHQQNLANLNRAGANIGQGVNRAGAAIGNWGNQAGRNAARTVGNVARSQPVRAVGNGLKKAGNTVSREVAKAGNTIRREASKARNTVNREVKKAGNTINKAGCSIGNIFAKKKKRC